MQVGANSQLNLVFFILFVYIFVPLIFMFLIIRTLDYLDNLLKSQRVSG